MRAFDLPELKKPHSKLSVTHPEKAPPFHREIRATSYWECPHQTTDVQN
jgi:hypothetical protein